MFELPGGRPKPDYRKQYFVIRVKCPSCGWAFNRQTINRVMCPRCGRGFTVVPKNPRKPHRIVGLVEGDLNALRRAISLKTAPLQLRRRKARRA